ncbi:lysophospholipid acyltransferase family protein [Pikeienuella sp. HZG-20]|uniref:lysophospholipid acyltransferase family protein n=1 Tax=Paludibacillus litoralis TaxID=3133267 RepID=UPI0030EF9E21
MRLLRSLIFFIWFYGLMVLIGLLFTPLAVWSRRGAYLGVRVFLRPAFWGLRVFCGLTAETRGTVPKGDVVIASKHQSFLDILILLRDLPAAKFVMKRSLVWAPVVGLYALRIGASPITRNRGFASIKELMREVGRRRALGGQLVIFPQGTRTAPGEAAPYRPGAYLICRTHNLPCVPAATNTGCFWPRGGIIRKPGVAVIEFLEPLPSDLGARAFTKALADRIEPASERLAAEAEARPGA